MGKNPAQKSAAKKTKTPSKTAAKKKKTTRPKSKSKKAKISSSTKVKSTTPKKVEKQASHKEEKQTSKPSCKIKKCKRPYRSKGYCSVHYKLWRHGEYGKARFKPCSEEECNTPKAINCHGYCEEHYQAHFVKKDSVPKVAEETAPETTEKEAPDKAEENTAEAS